MLEVAEGYLVASRPHDELPGFIRMWQVLVHCSKRRVYSSWIWMGAESSEAPSQRYEELETWCPQSDHATEKRMS